MRPDQQHGEKPAGVLGVLASIWAVGLVGENVNDFEHARAAVAEYIAANDEYDAAGEAVDQWFAGPGTAEDNVEKALAISSRFEAAEIRRAAAHARMKGETK